jgi:hypothetical protein
MVGIRGEEEWARRCVSRALCDVDVRHHDDGTRPAMHDLDILYSGGTTGAVEITAAADADCVELWNLINGGDDRWTDPALKGGWWVALFPHARAKRVRAELPALLAKLERRGITRLEGDDSFDQLHDVVRDLGIASVDQGGTDYPGSIYPTIELPLDRSGGAVSTSGDPLAEWVSEWIVAPKQAHNLEKLAGSGAHERHLFVILPGFCIAPFPVADLLMRDDAPLPTIAPDLPEAVTHVWLMSTWNTASGMRWSPDHSWDVFAKDVRG